MQIMDMTALELGRKIKEKEVSVKEAVQASLDTIEAKDKELQVVSRFSVQILSFTAAGTPASGPV